MKKQHGYTLIETLIAMLIVAALGASGLYGWQRWQQQQRLWQTAIQVRDYLLQLREDANWRNRDHVISVIRDGTSSVFCQLCCCANHVSTRFALGFYTATGRCRNGRDNAFTGLFGLRNTAWAGHIRLKNTTGEWRVVVSGWGRIRLCEKDEARLCQ